MSRLGQQKKRRRRIGYCILFCYNRCVWVFLNLIWLCKAKFNSTEKIYSANLLSYFPYARSLARAAVLIIYLRVSVCCCGSK